MTTGAAAREAVPMKDAKAVIVLRDGADVAEALRRLAPLGLRQVDSAKVAGAAAPFQPPAWCPPHPGRHVVGGARRIRPGLSHHELLAVTPSEKPLPNPGART